jgi:hypothetical protein
MRGPVTVRLLLALLVAPLGAAACEQATTPAPIPTPGLSVTTSPPTRAPTPSARGLITTTIGVKALAST